MFDKYTLPTSPVYAPATKAEPIVPHNTNQLPDVPKAIYVGGGGHIMMRGAEDNNDVLWKNVQAGSIIPFRPSHVLATGTTATDIVGLY